jgi:hypothetical protein
MRNFVLSLWYRYKEWRYERKCIKYFGSKPEKVYLSKEDYDALVERLNQPPDPKTQEAIRRILERRAPWDE